MMFKCLNSVSDYICRKLRDTDDQNRDLLSTVAKKEESTHQINVSIHIIL